MTSVILTGVPRATVPARQAHRRARMLLTATAAGPLLALVALAVAAGGRALPPAAVAAGHDRAFAEIAATDYLAGRSTALPYAQGLDPSLGRRAPGGHSGAGDVIGASSGPAPIVYRSLSWRSADVRRIGSLAYEVDTFVVAAPSGLWHLAVEVIDSAAGPVIGADPALSPDPMAPANTEAAITYGVAGSGPASTLDAGALRQVQAWAQAYANGDGSTLYRLTGDTRADTYATLSGWVFDQATVDASVVKAGAALAQVQVSMHRGADPNVAVDGSYDVLLGKLGQSLPFVEAWGPAGSGPSLVAYENALPTQA